MGADEAELLRLRLHSPLRSIVCDEGGSSPDPADDKQQLEALIKGFRIQLARPNASLIDDGLMPILAPASIARFQHLGK
jgi:hypothetical protein